MVLNNAKNIVKQVLSSGDTKGLLEAKDVGGTTRYIADFSAYPATVEDSFTLTAADAGISVGSGSTAPTATDYQLVSTITSGLTGSVTTVQNVDNDGNTSITFTLTLTNTSGSSISISEIGYKQEIAASDSVSGTTATDRVFLLDRTVFDTITLAASEQAIIDYTIKSVVTNSGGALGTKTISANGTYEALDDLLDGYSEVVVSVSPNVGTKNITQNGTYNASSDSYDGYSQVTVNVSGGGATLGTKTITQNGTYEAQDDNYDGYSEVTVQVSGGGGIGYTKATPNMTSNTTPSGEVIYSSYWSGYDPWYAFDGADDNGSRTWLSDYGDNVGSWIGYHFPDAVCIKKVEVSVRNSPSYPHAVKRFKVQASNDGTNWVDIQECTTTSSTALQKDSYIINNSYSYFYYRLYTLEVWDPQDVDHNAAYNQVVFYVTGSGTLARYYPSDLLPTLSGPNLSVVEASSEYSGYEAWKTLDGSVNTYWCSSTTGQKDYIIFHLAHAVYITEILVKLAESQDNTWIMYDDDTDTVIARQNSAQTDWWVVFEGTTSNKVQNIRLEADNTSYWKGIGEIYFWGIDVV